MSSDVATRVDTAFALVDDDPATAEATASAILEDPAVPTPERIRAQWARGMARRQRGQLQLGASDLDAAREAAAAAGELQLAARIDVTRAIVTFHTQSADAALALLDSAEPHLDGADLARLETQRGLILHRVGELDKAEQLYQRARRRFVHSPDGVGQIRLLNNLAVLYAQRGELARADERATEAYELADALGQRFMAAGSLHNRGYGRARMGRLGSAIDDIRAAEEEYLVLGREDLVHIARVDLAEVLLSANLIDEATEVAERALSGIRQHGTEMDVADACLLAARCRAAAGRAEHARAAAAEAIELLRRQERRSLLAAAEYVAVSLQLEDHDQSGRAETLSELSERLRSHGWWLESTGAAVLAALHWLRATDFAAANAVLDRLGPARRLPAAERAAVALARARIAEAMGERRRARRAISLGLRTVAENQSSLASFELRAFAAGHGAALQRLGAELAIADGRPRELLERLEATRARMTAGGAGDHVDPVLDELLSALRATTQELRAASAAGRVADELRRDQIELESRIRDRSRRVGGVDSRACASVDEALAAVGDRSLLEYALIGDRVWAVTVSRGRAALHDLGSAHGLGADIEACSFALNRLNRAGGSPASIDAAAATLAAVTEQLRERLVPPMLRRHDGPVVIVPDGSLHGVPWRAVVGAGGRPISVTPSLLGWFLASTGADRVPAREGVALVAGPGLRLAEAEVGAVAGVHPDASVLTGGAATVPAVVAAIAGTELAHLACHGAFRDDNPLFSTLLMHDGPITVHDLQGRGTLPRIMVLSACSAASAGALRGGTLLGLASALMAMGVNSVIAPLTPVNDEAVVDRMVELHRGLTSGRSPAEALAGVAGGAELDPVAAAFVALGA